MAPPDSSEQSANAGTSPSGIAYRDGFRILGTPLGMGGAKDARLRFISSPDERPPRKNERVLLHPKAAAAFGKGASSDVLAVEYKKKIRLGRMEIELFPSGLGPGVALLLLTFRGRRILYVGGVRTAVPLFSPPLETPKCDVVLLDCPSADSKPPSPRSVAKELVACVEGLIPSGPVALVVGTKTCALEVMSVFAPLSIPMVATSGLYEMSRRCESPTGREGGPARLSQRLPKEGLLLLPSDRWMRSRFFKALEKERVVYAGPGKARPSWASASFRMGEGEDRAGLVAFVKETGASHVILGQRCDDRLAPSLESAGVDVRHIARPVQMPFPFM